MLLMRGNTLAIESETMCDEDGVQRQCGPLHGQANMVAPNSHMWTDDVKISQCLSMSQEKEQCHGHTPTTLFSEPPHQATGQPSHNKSTNTYFAFVGA